MQAFARITFVKPTPEQAQRLREAVDEASRAGKSQDRIAKAAGYAGQSALGMALSRGSKPKQLAELLTELGIRMEWYKTGALPKFVRELGHAVSEESVTFPPQRDVELVAWRDMGMRELPTVFAVEAPDDAMAPVIRRRRKVEIDRSLQAGVDDIVLVRDSEGAHYLRNYFPLPKSRFEVRAETGGPAMESDRDELTVIGVVTHVHRR